MMDGGLNRTAALAESATCGVSRVISGEAARRVSGSLA